MTLDEVLEDLGGGDFFQKGLLLCEKLAIAFETGNWDGIAVEDFRNLQ